MTNKKRYAENENSIWLLILSISKKFGKLFISARLFTLFCVFCLLQLHWVTCGSVRTNVLALHPTLTRILIFGSLIPWKSLITVITVIYAGAVPRIPCSYYCFGYHAGPSFTSVSSRHYEKHVAGNSPHWLKNVWPFYGNAAIITVALVTPIYFQSRIEMILWLLSLLRPCNLKYIPTYPTHCGINPNCSR